MYQIQLSGRAKKELKKLDKRFVGKVTVSINLLKRNPLVGEKMSGEFWGFYNRKRRKPQSLRLGMNARLQSSAGGGNKGS